MPIIKERVFKNYTESSSVQLEKARMEREDNEIFLHLTFAFSKNTENEGVTVFLKTGQCSQLKINLKKTVKIKLKKELKTLDLTIKKIVFKSKTVKVKKSQIIEPEEKDSLEFFYSHPCLKILPSEMMCLFEKRKELFFPEIFASKDYFQCFCGKITEKNTPCPHCQRTFEEALAYENAYAQMEEARFSEKREKEKEIFADTLKERDLLLKELEEKVKEQQLIEREVKIFLAELKNKTLSKEHEELFSGKKKWLENLQKTKSEDLLSEIEGMSELLWLLNKN